MKPLTLEEARDEGRILVEAILKNGKHLWTTRATKHGGESLAMAWHMEPRFWDCWIYVDGRINLSPPGADLADSPLYHETALKQAEEQRQRWERWEREREERRARETEALWAARKAELGW